MSSTGQHCPFLNRTDGRCAEHFSLDHLNHALMYCFGTYQSCPVYFQLLNERQVRRGASPPAPPEIATNNGRAHDATFVQVTVATRYAKRFSPSAGISAASGI
jgi:hypothetical protein